MLLYVKLIYDRVCILSSAPELIIIVYKMYEVYGLTRAKHGSYYIEDHAYTVFSTETHLQDLAKRGIP
ncbi:hypothetical protein VNO78_28650 [Psophocarpus tetragonolobus]|uniref:Uncharacterized protein n=1 Tax=Psophocarpus tetragonolobus TaxID=3891 RepID=A0AAN9RTN2_PSOTE